MSDLPRCKRCGMTVTVVRDSQGFVAWCGCAQVSRHDPGFRDVGRGETAEEAVTAWEKTAR